MADIWSEFKKYLGDALPGGALNPELTTDINESPVPVGMAALRSFLGEAPDQLGVSVFHPQYRDVMRAAKPAFSAGTALQVAPAIGALNAIRGVKPAYKTVNTTSGIPLSQFVRDSERYIDAVGDRIPFYHVTNQPWEGTTPHPNTWFSNEAPTIDTPFGDIVHAYAAPRDTQIAGPFKRGRDFKALVDSATAPVVMVDDGLGVTSFIVKDPSILQEVTSARPISPLSSLKSRQRGMVKVSDTNRTSVYRAPQEDALETARANAVRMLGLPENNTAMDRARALGFFDDVYHSSLADITAFKPHGKFMGHHGVSGVSVTDSPEMASRYLDRYGERGWVDGVPNQPFSKNVIPLMIRKGNTLEVPVSPFRKGEQRLGFPLPDNYRNPMIDQGIDTLVVPDAISRKGVVKHSEAKNAIRGNELIVANPAQLRSRFAAFDPARMHESGLMYAQGGLAKMKECSCGR